ncbi:PPE family protein [Mycolicibacterium conceptionense]|nr:PPE family protein [Mycolicibacterium conceptionense]
MGYFYLHPNYGSSVINLNDPTSYQSYTSGNTTYYLVHTEHLPLLQPLRGTGILDPLLDLAEPTLRVLIDLAYDRTPENMGVPTRAGLIPHIDLDKLASDLAAAAEEGVRDALAGLGVHTADGFDHRTETATALGKPAAAKTTTGIAAAEEPQSEPTRREATSTDAATIDGTVAGADTVKSDPEVDTEVKAKTRPKPQAPAERIRQSLRHTFSPTTSNGVNDDRSGADRRAPLRSPRSDESGSARTKSATATTKNTGPHDKPRRSPRAARSDAA